MTTQNNELRDKLADILEDFGHEVVSNRDTTRKVLMRKPKAEIQQLINQEVLTVLKRLENETISHKHVGQMNDTVIVNNLISAIEAEKSKYAGE